MRALSLLNLASNSLWAEGTKLLAEALKGNRIITELNLSNNSATRKGTSFGDMSGVIALADAIPDMGAMTSLNLAENYMGADGAKHIAAAIKVIHCVLALILTLFSCPSDFVFNCWCLL